ncbi:integrating conjugative element protein [Azomonas macrocytogenes]
MLEPFQGCQPIQSALPSSGTEPYYQALSIQPEADASPVIPPPSRRVTDADMLPVQTQNLTPGRVARRAIQAPGLRPFFMVGADDMSQQWLVERAAALEAMGAMGMVVQVASAEQLADLRRLVPTLNLLPIAGDDVAARLALEHYPVLITATSIEQ